MQTLKYALDQGWRVLLNVVNSESLAGFDSNKKVYVLDVRDNVK